jgi:hypothetical protein
MKKVKPCSNISPQKLLTYWGIWMLSGAACMYLNIDPEASLVLVMLVIWNISFVGMQGYLFSLIPSEQNIKSRRLLWLLIATGMVLPIVEIIVITGIWWYLLNWIGYLIHG